MIHQRLSGCNGAEILANDVMGALECIEAHLDSAPTCQIIEGCITQEVDLWPVTSNHCRGLLHFSPARSVFAPGYGVLDHCVCNYQGDAWRNGDKLVAQVAAIEQQRAGPLRRLPR